MRRQSSILVLEDDEPTRLLIQDLLGEDYEVYAARDVLEAVDQLVNQVVDLLIVDLSLPVLDGVEFIRISRQPHSLNQIPILALAAYPELARCLDGLNVEAVLLKPFALLDLQLKVKELLLAPTLWKSIQHADGAQMEREVVLLYACKVRQKILAHQPLVLRHLTKRVRKSKAQLIRVESRLRSSHHLLKASAYRRGAARPHVSPSG